MRLSTVRGNRTPWDQDRRRKRLVPAALTGDPRYITEGNAPWQFQHCPSTRCRLTHDSRLAGSVVPDINRALGPIGLPDDIGLAVPINIGDLRLMGADPPGDDNLLKLQSTAVTID